MTVKLKTPSNGSVSLTPQDTASDVVLTVPSTAGSFVTANSSGNVGIGTASPGSKLDVNGELWATSTRGAGSGQDAAWLTAAGTVVTLLLGDSGGSGNGIFRYDRQSGGSLIRSGGSGGVTLGAGGTSWAAVSDERTKDIIEPIINAVEKVASLRAVIGKYKSDENGVRRSFLIAQDVQAVLPEAVSEVDDGENKTLNLAYTDVIPLLVAATKEQQAIINSLQDRIAALENA